MIHQYLTGRRRYRPQTVGDYLKAPEKLVLQVEVSQFVIGCDDRPGKWECVWRDAVKKDVGEREMYHPEQDDSSYGRKCRDGLPRPECNNVVGCYCKQVNDEIYRDVGEPL